MSNARLRRKLENLPAPIVAAMIDLGRVHNDGGILEFDYYGYCNPGVCIIEATARVRHANVVPIVPAADKRVRERL